jgi:hypothetical protein
VVDRLLDNRYPIVSFQMISPDDTGRHPVQQSMVVRWMIGLDPVDGDISCISSPSSMLDFKEIGRAHV